MTSKLPQKRLFAAKTAFAVLLGLPLISYVCAAAPAPQVEAGLDNFRHGQFAEALADWRQAAQAGDPRGALYVGVLYDSGVGVPRDFREAMRWYRHAAAGGSTVAVFNIAVLYDGGFGVPADQVEAAAWYQKAAEAGFGRAEYNLAMLYETGSGVGRDRNRAVTLYRTAAAHGISAATEHLAALREPVGPAPHRSSQDTASQEFEHAQQVLLSRGPGDATRAARLFQRAAERHSAVAEYDLGYCYEHGLGVTADPAKALMWYRRAASDATDDSLRSVAETSASTVAGQYPALETGRAN